MRSVLVVVVFPLIGYFSNVVQCSEYVGVQYGPSVAAVKAFYIAVLRRMPWLCVEEVDVVGLAPFLEYAGDELRTVVAAYAARLPFRPDDLFQCSYESGCWYGYRNLLRYSRAIEI